MYMIYGEKSPHWKSDRKEELMERIKEDTDLPYYPYLDLSYVDIIRSNNTPYLTMDCFDEGVYVRKVTNLSKDDLKVLGTQCDGIYKDVMLDEGETILSNSPLFQLSSGMNFITDNIQDMFNDIGWDKV